MLNGLYSSATALNLNMRNQEIVSHNLAHLNVPGFKGVMQVVENLASLASPNPNQQGASQIIDNLNGIFSSEQAVNFNQGRIESTGNPLHVAINGEGFFVVQGNDGPLYTRNGNFKINENSELTLITGQVVEGDSGPLQVPPNSTPAQIRISSDGSISVGQQSIGKIKVVQFADPRQLAVAGTTFFANTGGAPEDSDAQLQQFHLEASNVQAITEMIRMIAGMRHFEAAQRSMTTISEAISRHANQSES